MAKSRDYKRELRELKSLIRWRVEVKDLFQQKGIGLLIRRKFDPFDELKGELECITDRIDSILHS